MSPASVSKLAAAPVPSSGDNNARSLPAATAAALNAAY